MIPLKLQGSEVEAPLGRLRTMQVIIKHHGIQGVIVLTALVMTACGDSFMKESTRVRTSGLASLATTVDEAGNITAEIDPNATTTQILKFSSGALAGSAIAIPPGALAIPVSITVGEGETLTSAQFLQSLGISNNNVTAAGPSVSFVPSETVEATNPFTLSIPFTPTSLALADTNQDNIVVMYRWTRVVNGEAVHSMGIIPGEDVIISDQKVSFQTTKFGVFQIAKSETKIREHVNAPTIEPPVLKKDAGNPLVGTWGICENDALGRDDFKELSFTGPTWGAVSVRPSQPPEGQQTGGAAPQETVHLTFRPAMTSYSLNRYDSENCLGSAVPVNVYGNAAVISRAITQTASSLKLIATDGSAKASSCLPVYPRPITPPAIPPIWNPKIEIRDYIVGATWARIGWNPATLPKDSLVVTQHTASGCGDAGTSVKFYSKDNWTHIGDLTKSTSYNFKLSALGYAATCLTVKTTESDMTDWSYGNTHIFSTAYAVSIAFPSVQVDKHGYKLRVSVNGNTPVESSRELKTSDEGVDVADIPASTTGLITLITPVGCYFLDHQDVESKFFHLTGATVTHKLICDGQAETNGGGGPHFFGAVPNLSSYSKKKTLKITNGAFTMIEDLYRNSGCNERARLSTRIELGTVVLPGPDSVQGTHPVDVTSKDVSGVIFAEDAVRAANANPGQFGCGIGGWVRDKPQSILKTECGSPGRTEYHRLKIIGDRLFMCDQGQDRSEQAQTAADRIQTCEVDETAGESFKRQP
jgi:hypothetical protein